jgi:hypothetical protein
MAAIRAQHNDGRCWVAPIGAHHPTTDAAALNRAAVHGLNRR